MAKVPLREKLINSTGMVTKVWHRFFSSLEELTVTVESQPSNDIADIYSIDKTSGIQEQIDILNKKLEIMLNANINYQKQIDLLNKKIETLSKPVNYQKQLDLLNRHINIL